MNREKAAAEFQPTKILAMPEAMAAEPVGRRAAEIAVGTVRRTAEAAEITAEVGITAEAAQRTATVKAEPAAEITAEAAEMITAVEIAVKATKKNDNGFSGREEWPCQLPTGEE